MFSQSTGTMPASWPHGEFPFPNLQGGGGGLGAVTIQFREFGVRINFTPTITPRGTIRLAVTPEVSSLDFANGLIFQGFTIPALSTRRMSTEVELEEGQTFAIGGLLDNRDTETFNKVPGLGSIPFFGNLFRSRQITKNNSELLVMVTPEIVRPIAKGQPRPGLNYPGDFLPPNTPSNPTHHPGMDVTGPVPLTKVAPDASMPVEDLVKAMQTTSAATQASGTQPQLQFVPAVLAPQPGQAPAQPNSAPPSSAAPPTPAPATPTTSAPKTQGRERIECARITAGLIVESKRLWGEGESSLAPLPIRLAFEASACPRTGVRLWNAWIACNFGCDSAGYLLNCGSPSKRSCSACAPPVRNAAWFSR